MATRGGPGEQAPVGGLAVSTVNSAFQSAFAGDLPYSAFPARAKAAATGAARGLASIHWARQALGGYLLLFAIAWVVIPWLRNAEPPGDDIEQLQWAERLAWGYDKHPPGPTFILWMFQKVLPAHILLTYALGAAQVVVMLLVVWWLVRSMFGERQAIVAVLCVSCLTYYTNRLHFFNHNTALLDAYALSVVCAWQAARRRTLFWFVLLGLSWAAGLLSKYQMVVGIAANVAFLAFESRGRLLQLAPRLAISLAICAALLTPHMAWLAANQFPSIHYAATYVAANLPWFARPADVIGFAGNQIGRTSPLLLTLLPLYQKYRRATPAQTPASPSRTIAIRCITVHAWLPFAAMISLSLLLGTDLEMHWGTAFLWMVPLWALTTARGQVINRLPLRWLVVAVVALQAVMLTVYR